MGNGKAVHLHTSRMAIFLLPSNIANDTTSTFLCNFSTDASPRLS